MATREELYRKFGPQLLEVVVMIMKREINILRFQAGLQERTNQQILDALNDELNNTPEYDWMKENEDS